MLSLSKRAVKTTFEKNGRKIWSRTMLFKLIDENVDIWKTKENSPGAIAATGLSQTRVLNAILKETSLQQIKLDFPYRKVTRYLWGKASTYDIVQSVDEQGYFSHYTAMQVHDLTDQIPKSLYFNVEQPATGGGGSLTQGGIDRAFKGKCRVTNNVIKFRDTTIYKINGQNTGRLGVMSTTTDDGSEIQVTNIERTLIDIAVRPIYSGGIAEVATAYREAADRVSGNRLVTYLKSLNYTYPYHQIIGFYMDKAGNYKESQMSRLQKIPVEFDFYLTYKIKNPNFNEKWRLYIPKGF